MKTKFLPITMLLTLVFLSQSFTQDKKKAIDTESITWLGVDFSAAKLTLVPESEVAILTKYYPSINLVILSEPEKYDFKKWFNKKEVTNDIGMIRDINAKISASDLKTENDYTLEPEKVKEMIKKYNLNGKKGTGLIFIAENLNKPKAYGSFYVCFFDMGTKEIIDMKRYEGKASGIGFRNYWAGSIYSIMKIWLNE